MVTNDQGLLSIKHKIDEEVARLAWKGEITEEDKEELVYRISPGPKSEYRCCIYKETFIFYFTRNIICRICPLILFFSQGF